MKIINLKEQVNSLSNKSTIPLIQDIEINKGKTFSLPINKKIDRLHNFNKRRSIISSNQIEGIKISSEREKDILIDNLTPSTKEELLIVGYNRALEHIYDVYQYQSLTESFILDLHYLMYQSLNPDFGGRYKNEQNYIREFDNKGNLKRTVFIPAKAIDTPQLMGNLIYQYNECLKDSECNRLILIYVFILDFLCIHPFDDGNGRISRLLTTFLLLKSGYKVDMYYSLSYLVLKDINRYYSSLEKSSKDWHINKNNYFYFVHYMLEITAKGYKLLADILNINSLKCSALNRVLIYIYYSSDFVTKKDLKDTLFTLSEITIEKALGTLVKEKKIMRINYGKYTKYFKLTDLNSFHDSGYPQEQESHNDLNNLLKYLKENKQISDEIYSLVLSFDD